MQGLTSIVDLLISTEATVSAITEDIAAYCARESLPLGAADDAIAKYVALKFVRGEMSYADADVAMNALVGLDVINFDHTGFAWQVYLQFDNGEYQRSTEARDSIPWQQYTLPGVMALLKKNGIAILP